MWQDDLEQIVEIIQEVCTITTIRADHFELDTVRDLSEFEETRIRRFIVRADRDRVSLFLGTEAAYIEVESPDLRMRGMVAEVQRIARSCRRLRWVVESSFRRIIIPLTIGISLFTSALFAKPSGEPLFENSISDWISLGGGIALGLLWRHIVGPHSPGAVLYTKTRAESPTWLARNRDALVTNAIVSAVFLVIGIVVGYLLPK